MTEERYDALDRATLATWRVGNIVGWGAIALGAALLLHTLGDEVARRFHRFNLFALNERPASFFITWQSVAPQYGFRAFVAIVIGIAVGWIAGVKVWKGPARVAAAAASIYVLVTWLVLEVSFRDVTPRGVGATPDEQVASYGFPHHGLPSGAREWSYSAVGLIAVVAAPLVARFVAKRNGTRHANPRNP